MTSPPLPAWCGVIDEIVGRVANREGLSVEEVRKALTVVDKP